MIFVESFENHLFSLHAFFLEYLIYKYCRKEEHQSMSITNESYFKKLEKLVDSEIHRVFDEIIQPYDGQIKNLFRNSINLDITGDGYLRVTPEKQLYRLEDFINIFKDMHRGLIMNYQWKTLKRLQSIKYATIQADGVVDGEVSWGYNPRYLIRCFTDDNLLPMYKYIINSHYIKCWNNIKQNTDRMKDEEKWELVKLLPTDIEKFKNSFASKIIGKFFEEHPEAHGKILEYVTNFVKKLESIIDPRSAYQSIAKELLFDWLLQRSMVFEIYVFRKIADSGIPCLFRVLKKGKYEFDIVYCGQSDMGVIEIKGGHTSDDLTSKLNSVKEFGAKRLVVVCPNKSVYKNFLEQSTINNEVLILEFSELNDVDKVSLLVKGL
jgi:hypothetical protein